MIRSASPSLIEITYPPAPSSPLSSPADEGSHTRTASPPPDEHCFLIGADPTAIPFFPTPRVVVANGPPPTRDDLDWTDEATYQALLNRTTVRCANVLGQTALRDEDAVGAEEPPEYTLRLLEMHDESLPANAQGPIGRGYQCCLMKDSVPRACLAVYHVNPYYSTDLLYRVKAASYKSEQPLVAEAPEHIILALVGRQMALASCLVGVITNGHLLIVVEAGATNSVQASSLRTHTQAFIDCNATDATDNARRSQEGAYDPLAAKIAKLELLEDRTEGAGAHASFAREREAASLGFERADMMFIWYAVMLHAYEKHIEYIFRAFQIFQLWAAYGGHALGSASSSSAPVGNHRRRGVPDLSDLPAMPISPTETLPLYAEEEHMEMKRVDKSSKSTTTDEEDCDGDGDRFEAVRQGVEFQRVSTRISAPAPAWLRPFSASASTRATTQAVHDAGYLSPTPTRMPTPVRDDLAGKTPLSRSVGGGARAASGSGSTWGLSSAWLRNSTYTLPGSSWFRGSGTGGAGGSSNGASGGRDAAATSARASRVSAGWMQYSPPASPCLSDGGAATSESAYLLPDDNHERGSERNDVKERGRTSPGASGSSPSSTRKIRAAFGTANANSSLREEVTLVQEEVDLDAEGEHDGEEEIRFPVEDDEDKNRMSGRVGSQRMGWI